MKVIPEIHFVEDVKVYMPRDMTVRDMAETYKLSMTEAIYCYENSRFNAICGDDGSIFILNSLTKIQKVFALLHELLHHAVFQFFPIQYRMKSHQFIEKYLNFYFILNR